MTDREGNQYLAQRHARGQLSILSPARGRKKMSGLSGRQWVKYRKGERRAAKVKAKGTL